jgi:hypothetical protein
MPPSETGVLDPRPKLLRFHMPDLATAPKCQRKRPGEGRERRFITQLGHALERGRVSAQLILNHLQGTDTSYSFK